MLSEASVLTAPMLIAIGGLSGSGKSTLARALAPCLHAVVFRSDVIRKELMGVAETVRLGPGGYTREMTEQVYDTLFDRARKALAPDTPASAGQTVILDAVFSKQHERERAEALARDTGVRFCGLWLEVPSSLAASQIEGRSGDASDATVRVREMQEQRLETPILWKHLQGAALSPDAFAELGLQHILLP